jgi:DNA-binding transcriptional LysR family regulator
MNLRQIDYVLAVAEEENFTRAAERCHTVQSALSHQIARLEQEFGARLFERTSRQVTLTPAGQTFVKHARQVREAAQAGRRNGGCHRRNPRQPAHWLHFHAWPAGFARPCWRNTIAAIRRWMCSWPCA